ncbi:MAG: hypothetical protein QHC90_01010 [Shinella sp.]|nr:hypothetical protein [Shinella sp.]
MSTQFMARESERNSTLPPVEKARMVRALVDELIPGGDGWPSASEAGVHGIVSLRVLGEWSEEQIGRLAALLGWETGGLSSGDAAERVSAVRSMETADPDLFDKLYTAIVLAYYETPFVVEAIRSTGRPYSIRPHATGYAMAPFDFSRDTPNHGRGHYLKTDDVKPVDTSTLDLDTNRTERWGVER